MGAWELPPRASLLFSVSCRSSCKYIPQLSPFPRTLLSSVSHELFQQPLRTQSRCPCQDLENALISTFPLPRQVPPFAPDPQYPLPLLLGPTGTCLPGHSSLENAPSLPIIRPHETRPSWRSGAWRGGRRTWGRTPTWWHLCGLGSRRLVSSSQACGHFCCQQFRAWGFPLWHLIWVAGSTLCYGSWHWPRRRWSTNVLSFAAPHLPRIKSLTRLPANLPSGFRGCDSTYCMMALWVSWGCHSGWTDWVAWTTVLSAYSLRDFPCGPVAKTLNSECRGHGFNPWSPMSQPRVWVPHWRSHMLQLRPSAAKYIYI